MTGAAALGAVCVLVASQGGAVASASSKAVTSPPGAVIITAHSTRLGVGRVLVDAAGFSLYDFSGDGLESVTGCLPTNLGPNGMTCTSVWTPVLATGALVARGGVIQSGLGQIMRSDKSLQVTYFGQPLYRFVKDTAPGQVNGQDVTSFLGFWRLVSVDGQSAADRAAVNLELSADGPVLATPTAFGATRSLYVLSADPPGKSTCTGACAAVWPPLLTNRQPKAGPGVNNGAFGVLKRGDGTLQVTYNHKPLYLFAFDLGAGQPPNQTNGENFVDLATPATSGGGTTATIYAFSADTGTTSNCVGQCARFWPPMLTSEPPIAGPGADATLLGTIQRADGTFQIIYNNHPLYLFSNALDTTTAGEGITAFGGTFQVLTPSGDPS